MEQFIKMTLFFGLFFSFYYIDKGIKYIKDKKRKNKCMVKIAH